MLIVMKNKTKQTKRGKQMTLNKRKQMSKTEMIETLITETLKKRKSFKLYEQAFGADDQVTITAGHEWSTLFDLVSKFGAENEYAKRIR